jgi:transposase-like protein
MILSLAKLRVLIDVANTAKSAWDVVSRQAVRIKALEARVAAVESALEAIHGKSPGTPCPFCGERGWRLKEQPHSDRDARHEIWACQSCGREQDKWVPTGVGDRIL